MERGGRHSEGAGGSVLAAMSGGVDSSVAALLLLEQGYQVTGATMELIEGDAGASKAHDGSIPDGPGERGAADAAEGARTVCRSLGIEHLALDMKGLFEEKVVGPFCSAYLGGLTPNPCISCNRFLKFGAMHDLRRKLGIGYLATGHYARRSFDERSGRWQLLRGRDASKDQSYFLYGITQDQLEHTLFPLGGLTKREVRDIALRAGFSNARALESQDICFVPDGDHVGFIERRLAGPDMSGAFLGGAIVDRRGNRLGTHKGLIRYTAGQRKGIGVAAASPLYVFAKDVSKNELVVGTAEETLVSGIKVRDISLISAEGILGEQRVQAKTHYRQKPVQATAEQTDDGELVVIFDEPQRAAAPGQAAVLYDGDMVLGGGTVSGCL